VRKLFVGKSTTAPQARWESTGQLRLNAATKQRVIGYKPMRQSQIAADFRGRGSKKKEKHTGESEREKNTSWKGHST